MKRVTRASDARPARIALFGHFGSPNLGNEATIAAFLHNLAKRLPDAEFVCVAPRQSSVASVYAIPHIEFDPWPIAQHFWRIKPGWLRDVCSEVARRCTEPARARLAADLLDGVSALMLVGTGLIDDFGQRASDMPSHLNRWTSAARRRGLPVDYVSIGVSAVTSNASRSLFRRSLRRASYCSFRDAVSAENARKLGYSGASIVCPDLAFSLPVEWLAFEVQPRHRMTVGIGVMGYFGWNRTVAEGRLIYGCYLEKISGLVRSVLADGHDVQLLIGDTRADEIALRDVAALATKDEVQHGGCLRVARTRTFRDVLEQIGQTDVVVATRFHNVLLSIMLNRPTISIGYSDKNDALMADFGLGHYCHGLENLDVEAVRRQIDQLVRRPDEATAGLKQAISTARQSLDAQYDRLCAQWSS